MANNPKADKALLAAAASGDKAAFDSAVADGGSLSARGPDGFDAAGVAAFRGSHEVLHSILTASPAAALSRDELGRQPLHLAALAGSEPCVRAALGFDPSGALAGVPDGSDRRPLHWAAESGSDAVARLLLAAGADRSLRDENGDTAADIARENGFGNLAKAIESWTPPAAPALDVAAWRSGRQEPAPAADSAAKPPAPR